MRMRGEKRKRSRRGSGAMGMEADDVVAAILVFDGEMRCRDRGRWRGREMGIERKKNEGQFRLLTYSVYSINVCFVSWEVVVIISN